MSQSVRAVTGRTFRALGTRNYRLFFAGQTVSVTGTWLQSTAQAWLILQLTHSPLMLGLLVTVQFLPVTVAGLAGGVIADRFPRRRLLIGTQSAFALAAAVLAGLTWAGVTQPAEVFLVVFVFGAINVVDGPARQAFVTELVGPAQLPNAVALNSLVFNGARVVGPALAGILIALVGVPVCFGLNAVSYLAVIAGLWLVRPSELHRTRRPAGRPRGAMRELREGLAFVWHTPEIGLAIGLMAVVATLALNFSIFLPTLARSTLHAGAGGFGLLSAALGVGALAAALGVAYLGRASWPWLLGGCAVLGGFLVAAGQAHSLALAMLLLMGAGVGMITYTSMTNSLIQLRTPAHLRGRVMSIYLWIFLGTAPLGGLGVGAIEQVGGAPAGMALGGVAALLAAGVGAVALWRWAPANYGRSRGGLPIA
ncbi:MAG TPA: MFS transporter [Candidatus Dormibacteraeota bacterium]|nr:MFS transporter [Candidatus Dormibacteraeota bacterium]